MPSLGGRPLPGLATLSFFVGSLRRPILNVHQVAVDCQGPRREAEGENLIRQRKVVFDWIARRVILIPHARLPSAVLPIDELLLRHDKPAADPQRRKAVLMQKFVGARRRYAQRAGDKLRIEKQRQLVKIFDA